MNASTLAQPVKRFEAWSVFVDVVVCDDDTLSIELSDDPHFRTAEDARELAAALVRAAGFLGSQS